MPLLQLLVQRFSDPLLGSFQLVLLAPLLAHQMVKLSLQLGLCMQQEETDTFQDFWRISGKRFI